MQINSWSCIEVDGNVHTMNTISFDFDTERIVEEVLSYKSKLSDRYTYVFGSKHFNCT